MTDNTPGHTRPAYPMHEETTVLSGGKNSAVLTRLYRDLRQPTDQESQTRKALEATEIDPTTGERPTLPAELIANARAWITETWGPNYRYKPPFHSPIKHWAPRDIAHWIAAFYADGTEGFTNKHTPPSTRRSPVTTEMIRTMCNGILTTPAIVQRDDGSYTVVDLVDYDAHPTAQTGRAIDFDIIRTITGWALNPHTAMPETILNTIARDIADSWSEIVSCIAEPTATNEAADRPNGPDITQP